MAAPPYQGAEYKKDLVHNLGYNPIVKAFAWINGYNVSGLRDVPVWYWVRYYDPDIGAYFIAESITYEYLDNNTIRFYGPKNMKIFVQLFLEPREDAWYE